MIKGSSSNPFWIYGSGTFAREVFDRCFESGLQIIGIIDNSEADFKLFQDVSLQKSI